MNYALRNKKGETVRTIRWQGESVHVVRVVKTGRIEFTEDLKRYKTHGIEVDTLDLIKKSDANKGQISIKGADHLTLVPANTLIKKDTEATEEDEDQLPFFMKWSGAGYAAGILLLLIGTLIANKFFNKTEEMVIVKVIQQERQQTKRPTVSVSEKKVTQAKVTPKASTRNVEARNSNRTKNPKVIAKNSTNRPSPRNLHNVGALGALGGMSKDFSGAGGLNVNSKSKNSGYGNGGPAARGGHERGLVGKGLAASGIGNNSKLTGFGGNGTKGMGGGRPGYGSMRVGGTSAAFFQPLSEESLIEGGLDRDQINAVIQRNRGQVAYCYEKGLQQNPALSGRVEVKFVIASNGRVSAANVGSTSLSARQVENCIVDKLKQWKFPNPVGNVNVRVSYPFLLQRLSQG